MCLAPRQTRRPSGRTLTRIHGEVYDLAEFEHLHPGGRAFLRLAYARDATDLVESVHNLRSMSAVIASIKPFRVDASAIPPEDIPPASAHTYSWGKPSAFGIELVSEVREHFRKLATLRGVSLEEATKAGPRRWAIMLVLALAHVATLVGWMCGRWWSLLALPLASSAATFNIFHDASHGAISRRAWINEIGVGLGFTVSAPYNWLHQHIIGHHVHTNVVDFDPDFAHLKRWRKVPEALLPLALPAIWSIAVPIGLHVLAPFRLLTTGSFNEVVSGVPLTRGHKVDYIFRWTLQLLATYGWPWFVYPMAQAALWVVLPAALHSLIFMLITQIAHLTEATAPAVKPVDGVDSACFYEHQLQHSLDFAPSSRGCFLFTGGLNFQVAHHLFPSINHCHIRDVAAICERVAAKHKLRHHTCPTLGSALSQHWGLLKAERDAHLEQVNADASSPGSRVYVGKVTHSRLSRPGTSSSVAHSFSYDVPWVYLDLDEAAAGELPCSPTVLCADGSRNAPLSFRAEDHLRSFRPKTQAVGEGLLPDSASASESPPAALVRAVRRLVETEARGPLPKSARVGLLTNLRHFGYTFNPVSIYYITDGEATAGACNGPGADGAPRDGCRSPALLAAIFEVSNTPWDEEHVYVCTEPRALASLPAHDASCSDIMSHDIQSRSLDLATGTFDVLKRFHVSPFMPMHQTMRWKLRSPTTDSLRISAALVEHPKSQFEAAHPLHSRDAVYTAVRRQGSRAGRLRADGSVNDSEGGCPFLAIAEEADPAALLAPERGDAAQAAMPSTLLFEAHVVMTKSHPLNTHTAAWMLLRYPLHPHLVQWRIHVQAARLLWKKARFFPHPLGTKTRASRAVSAVANQGPTVLAGLLAAVAAVVTWYAKAH